MPTTTAKPKVAKRQRADLAQVMSNAEMVIALERLTDVVHRLHTAIQTRIEPPADRLTLEEAARRAAITPRTLQKIAARGVFTDYRRGKAQGVARLYLGDELDVLIQEGEAAVLRFREQMGRL